MFLARSIFVLFILLDSLNYSAVSCYPSYTVFDRLLCRRGFHFPAPGYGRAISNCQAKYPFAVRIVYTDCLNFCIAQEIQMFYYSDAHVLFNKSNLVNSLSDWFTGDEGPKRVTVIADGFEKCVKKHPIVVFNNVTCAYRRNLKSRQTVLWDCIEKEVPCNLPTTYEESKKEFHMI